MSTTLITVTIALTYLPVIPSSTGAAYASTSVVVTDSTGVAQPAVNVTPASPSFTTSVAAGAGSVTASNVDVNGAVIGTPTVQAFTEAGSPPTVPPISGITITPV